MQNASHSFSVLSARGAPAVLISACGTLIFSTSTRLARVVDRVRELPNTLGIVGTDFLYLRLRYADRRNAAGFAFSQIRNGVHADFTREISGTSRRRDGRDGEGSRQARCLISPYLNDSLQSLPMGAHLRYEIME